MSLAQPTLYAALPAVIPAEPARRRRAPDDSGNPQMLIMLSNFPDGFPCKPTPAQACCETGSTAPPRAIQTSRGSCRADDGRTRQLRPVARDRPAASPRSCASAGSAATTGSRCSPTIRSSTSLVYFGVMAYGATICTVHVEMNRNQLDNIFARLQAEAGALSGRARSSTICSPPCRRRGCGSGTGTRPRPDTFFARGRALRAGRRRRPTPGRTTTR